MKKNYKLSILVVFLLLAGSSFAQFTKTWTAQYQHTTAPNFSNEGRKIAEDGSGNSGAAAEIGHV